VDINGIRKRERELTTHHVGENIGEIDEKQSWQEKRPLCALS
jgi:hypothetical protein